MQKQRSRRHRKLTAGFNANAKLSESCRDAIRNLSGSLGCEGNFAFDYLREEYTSKLNEEVLFSSEFRRNAAIQKWKEVEKKNADSNRHLRSLDRGYNILPRTTWYSFLRFAQNVISNVLGPLNNEVIVGSFSGGASTSRPRTSSSIAGKFDGQADVTKEAAHLVDVIHHEVELFRHHNIFYDLREVEGAVLFTVPKKTDIDRCACKEPDINMYLQKGVGNHIRRSLLRFGINLNDQSINRRLAHRGSLLGDLATLDLSSASDSVTVSCVEALLPRDWFLYLNDIRSQRVIVDGTLVQTEMFSSMGNGFTFELESLIFYALMRTTLYYENVSGVVSVYGDDIIIPVEGYDMACWVLSEFGFSVNESKSFSSGPFRESCGGHYHSGEDVTPFYLRRPPERLTDVIRICNQLRRWAMADHGREHMAPIFTLWSELASHIPKGLWGGSDLDSDTQLVAPVPPFHRLVRVARRKRESQLGLYCHWQNRNWNRSLDPIEGYPPVATDSICRLRRSTPGAPYYRNEFYEELISSPDRPE